ncbi:MAG: hypothetical protein IBX43_06400 [Campylobacterales bacterium]|nr:hypothetical protein [Campylobacterales bacterium]
MKFLVSKNLHANPNYTLLLGFFAVMLLLYFAGDLFYLANFFGHTPLAVLQTLRGDLDAFVEPLSLASLLEHLHVSLFLAILAIFTTMAIVLRLNLQFRHKQLLILVSMSSLFLASLSLLGTYFFCDALVYAYLFFTLLWHLGASYALALILFELWVKKA